MQEGLWIRNYIPGTVLGIRDSAKTNIALVYALMELMV